MPSIVDIPTSPTMTKKRRREDLGSPVQTSSTHLVFEPQIHTEDTHTRIFHAYARKRIQDTGIKRQRIELERIPQPASSTPYTDTHYIRCPPAELPFYQTEITSERKVSITRKEKKVDLSPCHICHRKPTEKKQLDAYADCEGCGERTCFICVRECKGLSLLRKEEGDSGDVMVIEDSRGDERTRDRRDEPWDTGVVENHRRRICSRCCVEKGTEGEVWCLGCLRMEESG